MQYNICIHICVYMKPQLANWTGEAYNNARDNGHNVMEVHETQVPAQEDTKEQVKQGLKRLSQVKQLVSWCLHRPFALPGPLTSPSLFEIRWLLSSPPNPLFP